METKRPIERGFQRVVGGFVAFYTINACIAFAPKIDKGLPWPFAGGAVRSVGSTSGWA